MSRLHRRPNLTPDARPVRQLLILITMLVLVVVAMTRVRVPGMWTWLTGLGTEQSTSVPGANDHAINPLVDPEELPPGVFVAALPERTGLVANQDAQAAGVSDDSSKTETEIDRSVFAGIQDKTRVLPGRAYFHLLDVARHRGQPDLSQSARRDLTFAHFDRTPDLYRGELVLLKGHLQRLTEIRPVANAEGFERVYEGWLFTDESQGNPYVIVVSTLPDGMPLGGNVRESVSFAGYFLKLWTYQSGDGKRFAPLLIGHGLEWHRRPAMPLAGAGAHTAMLGIAIGLVILLGAAIWWSRHSTDRIRQAVELQPPRPSPEQVDSIGQLAGPSTEEFLAEMERAKLKDADLPGA